MKKRFCPHCGQATVVKQIHEHQRQLCSDERCGFIDWNNPTPVVAAIIRYDKQVLLVHNVAWPPKMLGLVSGFLEANEHPDEAIKREISEETALKTNQLEFLGHYPFPQHNQILFVYHAECQGSIELNEELDRYKLLDINQLQPWEFGTGPAVRDWLQQHREYSASSQGLSILERRTRQ